ncbi:hypothetical protein ACOMHN_034093 [Nucella lapillus]
MATPAEAGCPVRVHVETRAFAASRHEEQQTEGSIPPWPPLAALAPLGIIATSAGLLGPEGQLHRERAAVPQDMEHEDGKTVLKDRKRLIV